MAATTTMLLRQVPRRSGCSTTLVGLQQARPSMSTLRGLATSATTTSTSTCTSRPIHSPRATFDWPTLLEEKKTWSEAANGETMLIQDLRSDHAGETGAVYIYKGALAAMSVGSPTRFSDAARHFVQTHHDTEVQHLAYFDRLLDNRMKSKLLPLWRLSGWGLGFFPTVLFGEKALYCTVESVESFVEVHYNDQIYPLECRRAYPELVALLKHCCEEEVHHKEDAKAHWLGEGEQRSWYATLWAQVVEKGSQGAVAVCKRI